MMSTHANEGLAVEASTAVEILARNVLSAAGLSPTAPTNTADADTASPPGGDGCLSRLERAAGCHLAPLPPIAASGDGNGVLTCTDPNEGSGSSSTKKGPASDVWNPLDAVSGSGASSIEICDDDNDNDDCLEDMVPFSHNFYRCVGELLCECYAPGSFSRGGGQQVVVGGVAGGSHTSSDNAAADVRYSLPRDNDAVRATRLLCVMMEYNVDEDGCSFLSLLLRHCEGNKPNTSGSTRAPGTSSGGGGDDDDSKMSTEAKAAATVDHHDVKRMRRVPIISAAFRHLSSLPSLEAYVRSWVRRRRYPQSSRSVVIDATVTLATPEPSSSSSSSQQQSGPTTTQLSSDAASDRLRSMKIWESEKDRLEAELSRHMSMLEYILGSMYKECDVDLRGRCRTKLGGMLHFFSLSSGGPAPMARFGGLDSVGVGAIAGVAAGGPGLIGVEDASAAGIDAALKILLRIVEGIDRRSQQPTQQPVLGPSHESLLFDILVPLHKPSGMVLWRDQTPVLGLYHETLVRCIGALLVRNKHLIAKVVRALLHPDIWPTEGGAKGRGRGRAGGAGVVANTPKVVLLLHEVDTYLGLLHVAPPNGENGNRYDANAERGVLISSFSDTILPLTVRLASCIESDNSRSSERALQYFRNAQFSTLIKRYKETIVPVLLRALCRVDAGMQVPWNPTVRKMTLLVLTELEAIDKALFQQSCEHAFGTRHREHINQADNDAEEMPNVAASGAAHSGSAVMETGPAAGVVTQNMTTLRGGMGSWRPPTGTGAGSSSRVPRSHTSSRSGMPRAGGSGQQPPLTVTGVAPWAAGGGSQQPPLTVTGVAPWAVGRGGTSHSATRAGAQRTTKQSGRGMAPWAMPRASAGPPISKRKASGLAPMQESADKSSLQRVRRYMEELKPPKVDGEDDSDGVSSWAKAQMAESPTLLPSLKFHDLVFGQNLGEGSFGSVRYARQIVKGRTRSHWPEYAVKVVSTQKISELGYEQSINREIATLRTMSHPGIARLISTFRFRDGAYLVLEYASGGDLHTLLKRNGSIDHKSTQFVIGEIVAALSSIHDAGFVYGDLKPENCLITESGHIKLTDFGGCRPFTEEAKQMVKLSSKNVIKDLRAGDWKEMPNEPNQTANIDNESFGFDDDRNRTESAHEDDDTKGEEEEDYRVEGTTAYLPPEVVVGNIPTLAADSWALGCVLYQCISGRPPLLEDTDHLTRHKIVTFELSSPSHEEDFFGIHDDSTFRPDAKELIRQLLSRNPNDRPSMHTVAHDDFFEGKDVFQLHKQEAYPLDVGSVAPVADAKWNRRQFSSIWAPQPKLYAIDSLSISDSGGSTTWEKERNSPILEGLERDSGFLSTRRPMMRIGE